MASIERIRRKIHRREYFISSHAEEELRDDGVDRFKEDASLIIITAYALEMENDM